MSGGPILVNGVAVGIQSRQSPNANEINFAHPISPENNLYIAASLKGQLSLKHLKSDFLSQLKFAKPKNKSLNKRFSLLIYDHLDDLQNSISDAFTSMDAESIIIQKHTTEVTKLNTLFTRNLTPIRLNPTGKNVREVESISETITNIEQFEFEPDFSSLLRIVIDINGKIIYQNDILLADKKNAHTSHLSGLSLIYDESGPQVILKSESNFDTLYEIRFSSLGDVIKILRRLMLDILIDISFFNSLPWLVGLFSTIESQRAFSKRKVNYVVRYGHKFRGNEIPDKIDYISFANICWNEEFDEIDLKKYFEIWRGFLEGGNGFYRHGGNSFDPSTDSPLTSPLFPISTQQLIEQLKNLRKIHGQLPIKSIENKLNNTSLKDNSIYAIAFVVKRPKKEQDYRRIESFFGQPYRRMIYGIFSVDELNGLMPVVHLLEFHFFMMKN